MFISDFTERLTVAYTAVLGIDFYGWREPLYKSNNVIEYVVAFSFINLFERAFL